jgi:hypothetical protein
MKKFALLDENNLVINISVADENWDNTGWIEYTNKNCGIGYTYNLELDLFITPKCHDEAILNQTNGLWECSNADHETLA